MDRVTDSMGHSRRRARAPKRSRDTVSETQRSASKTDVADGASEHRPRVLKRHGHRHRGGPFKAPPVLISDRRDLVVEAMACVGSGLDARDARPDERTTDERSATTRGTTGCAQGLGSNV